MAFKRFAWNALIVLAAATVAYAGWWVSGHLSLESSGMVSGRVTDMDGRPLPNVVVRLDDVDKVEISADDGTFAFVDVPPGTYWLSVSATDRGGQRLLITVSSDTELKLGDLRIFNPRR